MYEGIFKIFFIIMLHCHITSQHLMRWKIQHLLHDLTDYLACGIMPYMHFAVHTVGMYRTSILDRVHAAFFNYQQFNEMTNMLHEIILARIMTDLDLEFKRALHYHNEGYESDNDYWLPTQVMRPVYVYSISTTEASLNPADYKGTQCPMSAFTPRWPRDELPFCQGVCWCLTYHETPTPEVDSDDEEYLPTYDLDYPAWSKEHVPNNQKYPCIHQIPRPAIPTQSSGDAPRARTNGYRDPGGPTRPHQCPWRTVIWLWFLCAQCARLPMVV